MGGAIYTDILIYMRMIKDNNMAMVHGKQISIWHLLFSKRKTAKTPSQIGRSHRLNSGPPECESRVLPRSELALISYPLFGLFLTYLQHLLSWISASA